MLIKLKDLAQIRTGLVLSRKQSNKGSDYLYNQLTLKSMNAAGYIDVSLLDEYYAMEDLKEIYLTSVDDIIVKLTAPYTAVLIDETTKGLVVPSQFVIIKCNPQKISPIFLVWILNSDIAKKEFVSNNTSNMLGAIRPHFVGEIELKDMSIEMQNTLGEMYVLAQKEQRLLEELKEKKEKYIKTILEKVYKEHG